MLRRQFFHARTPARIRHITNTIYWRQLSFSTQPIIKPLFLFFYIVAYEKSNEQIAR